MREQRRRQTGNFDVFDYLYDFIAKRQIHIPAAVDLHDLVIKNLNLIESYLEDLISDHSQHNIFHIRSIEDGLNRFASLLDLSVKDKFPEGDVLYNLLMFTSYVNLILENCLNVKIHKYVDFNYSNNLRFLNFKEDISLLKEQEADFYHRTSPGEKLFHLITYSFHQPLMIFCDGFIAKNIQWDKKNLCYSIVKSRYFFDLTIKVGKTEGKNVSDIIAPIYLITGAIEKIKNTSTTLNAIGIGSLISELFIWADDLVAKEEVKSVFDTSQSTLIKESGIKLEDYEKEVKGKLRELKNPESNSNKSVEQIKLEMKKLKLIQEKLKTVKVISDLVNQGVLMADDLSIEINTIPFIRFANGKAYITGTNIDEIAE